MRHNRYFPSILALGLGLAVVVVSLGQPPRAFAQLPSHDPVEHLRRDLKDGLTAKEADLHDRALTSIGDLRRALDLTEWRIGVVERGLRQKLGDRFKAKLKASLASASATVRLAAATVVAEIGTSSTSTGEHSPAVLTRTLVPEFVKLTEDVDLHVRAAAALALGRMNAGPIETWVYKDKKATVKIVPSPAVPALTKLLKSRNPAERRAAAEALIGLVRDAAQYTRGGTAGPRIETTQVELLATGAEVAPLAGKTLEDQSSDAVVRRLCVDAIQQTVSDLLLVLSLPPRVGDALPSKLIAILPADFRTLPEEDQEKIKKEVRADAAKLNEATLAALVKTLGQTGATVAAHLRDADPEVRLSVRRTLEDLARVRISLQKRQPAKANRMVKAASQNSDGKTSAASSTGKKIGLVRAALEADEEPEDPIGKALDQAVATLSQGSKLADSDLAVRLASIDFLERLGEDAAPATSALIERLDKSKEPNRFVRWGGGAALGKTMSKTNRLADQKKATPALALLLADSDPDVMLAAAVTLESYGAGAGEAVPALIEAVKDGDAIFRKAAINVLVSIGPGSRPAIRALVIALGDADARIRQAAAEGLGKLGKADDKSAIAGLREILADENGEVRRTAGEALVNIMQREKE